MKIVWLRNAGDEEDECWVPCAKTDPGAVEFKHGADVWYNRQIDDLQRMCEQLVAEKKFMRKALEEARNDWMECHLVDQASPSPDLKASQRPTVSSETNSPPTQSHLAGKGEL